MSISIENDYNHVKHAENITIYIIGNTIENGNTISVSIQRKEHLLEIYNELTYSNRAKVLSLIETLLEEQESQT